MASLNTVVLDTILAKNKRVAVGVAEAILEDWNERSPPPGATMKSTRSFSAEIGTKEQLNDLFVDVARILMGSGIRFGWSKITHFQKRNRYYVIVEISALSEEGRRRVEETYGFKIDEPPEENPTSE